MIQYLSYTVQIVTVLYGIYFLLSAFGIFKFVKYIKHKRKHPMIEQSEDKETFLLNEIECSGLESDNLKGNTKRAMDIRVRSPTNKESFFSLKS